MSDLDLLFRRLVDGLIALDPARLHQPVRVAELIRSIIPYRTSRGVLGLDTVEDYDLLVLRLLSGEGGFVTVRPEEVATRARNEMQGPNPDPALLREFGGAEVALATDRVARALGPGPEAAWAPPESTEAEVPHEAADDFDEQLEGDADPGVIETGRVPWTVDALGTRGVIPLNTSAVPDEGTRCGYCGGLLPTTGRQVNFCPHCGQSQTFIRCSECGNEVEFGWKHCVACGAATDLE